MNTSEWTMNDANRFLHQLDDLYDRC